MQTKLRIKKYIFAYVLATHLTVSIEYIVCNTGFCSSALIVCFSRPKTSSPLVYINSSHSTAGPT